MMARIVVPLAVAGAIVACASIDPPAPFTAEEAGVDPAAPDGATCRRILPRTFAGNASAKLYGPPGGSQAICVTLVILAVPQAGPALVTFCIAGDLSKAASRTPRDIGLDPRTCAYCLDVRTNCRQADGGVSSPCDTSYSPIRGKMRIVSWVDAGAGDEVWIDVGDVTLARIRERTDSGAFFLEPTDVDCLLADGLTFQGKLEAATSCTEDSIECQIANSASTRFP